MAATRKTVVVLDSAGVNSWNASPANGMLSPCCLPLPPPSIAEFEPTCRDVQRKRCMDVCSPPSRLGASNALWVQMSANVDSWSPRGGRPPIRIHMRPRDACANRFLYPQRFVGGASSRSSRAYRHAGAGIPTSISRPCDATSERETCFDIRRTTGEEHGSRRFARLAAARTASTPDGRITGLCTPCLEDEFERVFDGNRPNPVLCGDTGLPSAGWLVPPTVQFRAVAATRLGKFLSQGEGSAAGAGEEAGGGAEEAG